MVDEAVLSVVQAYLQDVERNGIPVSFGVLFGSQAKGTADRYSDIDVMVVSPAFDGPRSRDDISLIKTLAYRFKSLIEPIACGERQWREDDGTPIIEVARREGHRVSIHPDAGVARKD